MRHDDWMAVRSRRNALRGDDARAAAVGAPLRHDAVVVVSLSAGLITTHTRSLMTSLRDGFSSSSFLLFLCASPFSPVSFSSLLSSLFLMVRGAQMVVRFVLGFDSLRGQVERQTNRQRSCPVLSFSFSFSRVGAWLRLRLASLAWLGPQGR
ncbi:hypothetical protein BC567DRAFT_223691, partial [Phyllosticta citribraziliensis]